MGWQVWAAHSCDAGRTAFGVSISLAGLRLYWETARHLRSSQIWRRILFRAVRPTPELRPPPPLRPQSGPWTSPARRRQSQIGPDTFRFLNETHTLPAHGWDDPSIAKLWRYNLHYFDDLSAIDAVQRVEWHRALVTRWIAENPPGTGTGWEPYPTSLRIVNWIKWWHSGNDLSPAALDSLAVQARWLTRRLEYHLLGNHLFSNAKALVFAGCLFDGAEAESWRELGLRILTHEISEQVLPDGGHFELSPMYHSLALEDLLDLVNLSRAWPHAMPNDIIDVLKSRIGPMRAWLTAMQHPDGEIAFFNDTAIGVAPAPAELEDYAGRLGFAPWVADRSGIQWQRDSGYIRVERGGAVALLDVARVGPDYLPGHAHADTLSFELTVNMHRAIVNSGTSVYGIGPERLRQRGTTAHNTVVVDSKDSSEVWSGFRVARRAKPQDLSVRQESAGWIISCAHDGYRRLKGRPLHRRSWDFGEACLTVYDIVEGDHHHAEAMFHFHPDLTPTLGEGNRSGTLTLDGETIMHWRINKGTPRLEQSTWHPEFGVTLKTRRLAIELESGESSIEFYWTSQ